MPNLPSLVEMLKSGMHFGHKSSRWHPKMAEYIFGEKSGIHIVNLENTQKQLEKALVCIKDIVARGGIVLFVGTKPQAKKPIDDAATDCGMPFVNERWLGGTLTNYHQIKKELKELKTLKDQRDKGELRKYTKKERLLIDRKIIDMQRKFGGIENLEKTPEAVLVIDITTEKTAVREARAVGAKIIALCDTNVNPKLIDYIIPGNDDAVKAIELVLKLAAEAIKEGKASPINVEKIQEKQKTNNVI
ncbi:MAG: 30S ribosomal protein S2 [Patescibacteria group bacterium]